MRERRLMRDGVLGLVLALPLSLHPAAAGGLDCDDVLRMHGFLRTAARVCGFTRYNEDIVADARSCFDAVGSVRGARDMYAGADEFTRVDAIRDRDGLCADLLRRFPTAVRP
jgi:hypothetical protein